MTKPDNDTAPLHSSPPTSDEVLRGWYEIARFLEVSERTARRLSDWGRECRCPVFEDYRGPLARRSELRRWQADSLLPTGVRGRMRTPGGRARRRLTRR